MFTNDANAWIAVLSVTLVIGFFILVTVCGLSLAAWIGGWSRLARHFRYLGEAPSNYTGFVSGSVGWIRYRSCLIVGMSPSGLYLSTFFLFRFLHPPLLIPWSSVVSRTRRGFLLWKRDVFEIEAGSRIRVGLRASATAGVESYFPAPVALTESR